MLSEQLQEEVKAAKNRESQKKHRARMTTEERKEYDKARYQRTKEAYAKRSKEWSQNNPHKSQASSHQNSIKNRYPEAWENTDIVTSELSYWLKEHRGDTCPYCKQYSFHIDHIEPLSKGGEHRWSNIELICETCNIAKKDRSKQEYTLWILSLVDNISSIYSHTCK